jgi:hypothetical protein
MAAEGEVPMATMLNGIAHVSFLGGGIFLPARTPYDRQILLEHVADRVHVKGRVQVLMHDRRWLVQLNHGPSAMHCTSCNAPMDSVCVVDNGDLPYCLRCVFETCVEPVRSLPELRLRTAG